MDGGKMINLRAELPAAERIVLAVDTSDLNKASESAALAKAAGASIIKEGLQLLTASGSSPEVCSNIALEAGLDWIADQKLDDIPNTVAQTVRNYTELAHPPVGITIHTNSGVNAMEAAQDVVDSDNRGIKLLAVTELTTKTEFALSTRLVKVMGRLGIELDEEFFDELDEDAVRKALVYGDALDAVRAGVGGLVASAKELVDPIGTEPSFEGMVKMIPGTRSKGEETHDQLNVTTPYEAIVDGANLLVIGRQVTGADNPEQAFQQVVNEIQEGIKDRKVGV